MGSSTQNINNIKISVVVPAYNEGENVVVLAERLTTILSKYGDWQILFVDDGSKDNTLSCLRLLSEKNNRIKYLSLSRNFGHQKALKAGLDHATGDCVISMDADMQHPPELLDEMIERWQQGYEVVTTIREDAKSLSFYKRKSSALFYKLMNILSDIEIRPSASDFRLLDRSVVDVLKEMKESHIFMRGMIPWLGFRECSVRYMPAERLTGESKYSTARMMALGIDGITSFSIRPLQLSTIIGALVSFSAFIYGIYAIFVRFIMGKEVSGWASVIISILFIGGLQLLMLGILGDYLGKVFVESKKRPIYVIRERQL